MRRPIFAIGLVIWGCGAALSAPAAPPNVGDAAPSGEPESTASDVSLQMQTWVRELAATEYGTRRKAFMSLWEQGLSALPAVQSAAVDSDQQIAGAARVLELLLKFEIRPKDNAELAELMQMSRQAMHRAIMSLAEKGHWRLATELLRSNESTLDAYRKSGRSEWLCMVVQSAYDQGDARKAWPVVQQLLNPVHSQWIAAQAGLALDEPQAKSNIDSQALALLFRGEYEEAWALRPSVDVQQRIIFLSGRWEWLQDDALRTLIGGGDSKAIEGRAKQAAYAFLANEVERSDQLMGEVLKELRNTDNQELKVPPESKAPNAPGRPWEEEDGMDRRTQELIMALLVCGEGQAVHELIPKDRRREHLIYFGARLEYDHALDAFGLSADLSDYDAWLDTTIAALTPTLRKASPGRGLDDFQQLCDLASFLVAMGRVDEGIRLYEKLMDATQSAPEVYRDQTWRYLAIQGRQTQFRSHLIRLLDQRGGELSPEGRKLFFAALYPEWNSIAVSLWKTAPPELVQQTPSVLSANGQTDSINATPTTKSNTPRKEERRWELMERLWRFDRQLITEHPSEPLVETWLKHALREASPMEETVPAAASQSMSKIALRLGLRSLALSFAKTGKSRSALADAAEVYMHENSFENANLLWEGAIRTDPWRHDWILEQLNALSMLGEQEKATALQNSRWLRPLAIERAGPSYWTMAANLQENGQTELARDYAYAAFALLDPTSPQLLSSARTYAEILQELEDYSKSADVHRAINLMLLSQPGLEYPLSTIQHVVSEEFLARAIADLDAGKADAALDRIQRFERLRPSGIEICEHTYERLVKNNRQGEADALLERCRGRMLKHLEQWPGDAGSHNNLAWMYARCNQRLDEALKHAELAVQLSDDAPTYVDTLAETHFRLNHIDEALRLAEKCAALDPRHAHYRKQLHRFREAHRAQAR